MFKFMFCPKFLQIIFKNSWLLYCFLFTKIRCCSFVTRAFHLRQATFEIVLMFILHSYIIQRAFVFFFKVTLYDTTFIFDYRTNLLYRTALLFIIFKAIFVLNYEWTLLYSPKHIFNSKHAENIVDYMIYTSIFFYIL